MMVTKEQAVNLENKEFHAGTRYGLPVSECDVWRRNGNTQTWKTRPTEFRIPVKFGLYDYGNITQETAEFFHLPG